MKPLFLILAPMRGITTMHYRKAFVRHFGGLDAEMAPFIPTVHAEKINPKLLRDVLPENNSGLPLIPQLIGKNAAEFVTMARALHDLGYEEVNWNLGCPHKPIRNKRRGSGLLPHPDTVDALLGEICSGSPCKVSVKVRLGVSDKSDLLNLIPVLNRHPLSEVIVHPRTAEQMYDGTVDLDAFAEAYEKIEHPVCYNGDIDSLAFFQTLEAKFPNIGKFMLGRGLLANPFLCEQIKSGNPKTENAVSRLKVFHDEVFANYQTVIDGEVPMLGKMKEFWAYPAQHLSIRLRATAARQDGRKFLKKIKKCHRLATYHQIVDEFLSDAEWTA
jgi:tRNA-dihydrouridine synthase